MNKAFFAACLLLVGCVATPPFTSRATMILKAEVDARAHSQADTPVYSKSLVHHLTLKLYNLTNGDQDTGVERTLLGAQLDNPVVIGSLKPNTHYRVRAYAYFSSDDSQLISTSDSYADVQVLADDRPSLGTLNVRLMDRLFSAQASSTLTINPGGYSPIGTESLTLPGLEGIVTTLAGSGSAGIADGTGTQAGFYQPCGIVSDSTGNLFVVDRYNHRIRKVTLNGAVTTFAGNGTPVSLDGNGTAAQFYDPFGIAVDSQDNLYVTEANGCRIRKITPQGVVSTWVGSGQNASEDGNGTAAKLSYPHGIAVSSSGEIYFTEGWSLSNRIRKITASRDVITVAGGLGSGWLDGTGTAALFYSAAGLAFDKNGNLFIADTLNHRIRKMTPEGVVTTVAGSGIPGTRDAYGTNAQLDNPSSIAFDKDGTLYVKSGWTYSVHRIVKITPNALVSNLAGYGSGMQDGTGYAAKFNTPEGICFGKDGAMYVSDRYNHVIRRIR